MSRAPVTVRVAEPEDARDLIEVWTEGAPEHPLDDVERRATEGLLITPQPSEAAGAIARIAADPAERLLVAQSDQRIVGAVHLRRSPVSPIQQAEAVHMSHLRVLPDHRRRGVATALLSAATAWAAEKDSTHVLATSPASTREAHRFLARLGFGQIAIVRAAPVNALRARFAGLAAGSRDTGRLIAQRRTLRRRRAQPLAGRNG
ncbi:MAG: GNAT family N-acetyltransferase [Nocardioidaceae bacterium]|nr:GNAT family N-acetyltransferase [Nocardioidaceae bacterium]